MGIERRSDALDEGGLGDAPAEAGGGDVGSGVFAGEGVGLEVGGDIGGEDGAGGGQLPIRGAADGLQLWRGFCPEE